MIVEQRGDLLRQALESHFYGMPVKHNNRVHQAIDPTVVIFQASDEARSSVKIARCIPSQIGWSAIPSDTGIEVTVRARSEKTVLHAAYSISGESTCA